MHNKELRLWDATFFYKNQNRPSCPAHICRKTDTQYFNGIAASDLLDVLCHFGQSAVIHGKILEMDGFLKYIYIQNIIIALHGAVVVPRTWWLVFSV